MNAENAHAVDAVGDQHIGFADAQEYGIKTTQGDNIDAFMALELFPGGLDGFRGRLHEEQGVSHRRGRTGEV